MRSWRATLRRMTVAIKMPIAAVSPVQVDVSADTAREVSWRRPMFAVGGADGEQRDAQFGR